jgi:hypothetical protein
MISGRNAMGNGVSLAQQYVTLDFTYQNNLPFPFLTSKSATRNAFGGTLRCHC